MARSDILNDVYGNVLNLATTIDRYQELMRLPVAAFNGLYRPADATYDCDTIWQQTDRDNLAENLRLAQEMREVELGFPLAPTYIDEEYDYANPLILKSKHLQKIGLRTITDLGTLAISDFTLDLIELTLAVTFTDPSELHLYYPDEDVEIIPQSIRISGGTATIIIPKARLVKPEYNVNYNEADSTDLGVHLYENNTLYLTSIDVKRVYYDESQGIQIVWNPDPCSTDSDEITQYAKGLINNRRLSIIDLHTATFSSETAYVYTNPTRWYRPGKIRIRYVAGATQDMRNQMITARLSHIQPNKLSPCEICWRDDVLPHPSKMNTPYGISVAAVAAWIADSRYKIGHGKTIKRER